MKKSLLWNFFTLIYLMLVLLLCMYLTPLLGKTGKEGGNNIIDHSFT